MGTYNLTVFVYSFGCSNPIWGLTKNPIDKLRTPGGSTGGEACLIAAGGSPIGTLFYSLFTSKFYDEFFN